MQYNAIIADDEQALCEHLRAQLQNLWPQLNIIDCYHNGEDAQRAIQTLRPHIAFLDIKMPVLSGLQVAMSCHDISRIVFISAYEEFAVEAFEHAAIDYILKPVTESRLTRTVERLQNSLAEHQATADSTWQESIKTLLSTLHNQQSGSALNWIRAGVGDKTVLLSVDDICYFQANHKYVSVFTAQSEYLIKTPIKELLQRLPQHQFQQVSRSSIVNLNHVKYFKKGLNGRRQLYLKNRKETLMVSRLYNHLFQQM